jgi:hypothetical protein
MFAERAVLQCAPGLKMNRNLLRKNHVTHKLTLILTANYIVGQQNILKFLQKMSDEQLRWQPAGSNCIAWHAWHLARWADYFQASVPGMTPELTRRLGAGTQVWDTENLAETWGFEHDRLGFAQTGMQMPDEVALNLPFPAKDVLLDYMARAFAASERAVKVLDDEQLASTEQRQPLTEGIWGGKAVADALLAHIRHDNRHLGMMEALLGLQGRSGSATV